MWRQSNPRCCGLDVHKASVCAFISIKDDGSAVKEKRRFETTAAELRRLAGWLREWKVTKAAMEATGVYWKRVWNILEEEFELLLSLVRLTPSQYRNTVETAYGLLPRPPQTQAARFKRLYQK